MKFATGFAILLAAFQTGSRNGDHVLSPDRRLNVTLELSERMTLRVSDAATPLFTLSSITLAVRGEKPFGVQPGKVKTERSSRDTTIRPQIREKCAVIHERYNQATVTFSGGYGIVLRVFDEGVAYRLVHFASREHRCGPGILRTDASRQRQDHVSVQQGILVFIRESLPDFHRSGNPPGGVLQSSVACGFAEWPETPHDRGEHPGVSGTLDKACGWRQASACLPGLPS